MRRRRRRRRTIPEEDREARLGASREIGRAMRSIRAVRTFYIACTIIAGLGTLLFVLAADFEEAAWRWLVGIAGGTTLLLALGALYVVRSPLPWSIGIAVVVSILAGTVYLLIGPGFNSIGGLLLAAALWVIVTMAHKADRLARQHPDMYATERWQGRRPPPRHRKR